MGDALEVLEGLLAAADERRQLLVVRCPDKEPAAVAQGHHEQMPVDAAARDRRPTVTPVDLVLPAGLRLEAHCSLPGRLFPKGLHEAPNRVVASCVAQQAKLLEGRQDSSAHGGKPLTDVLFTGSQQSHLRAFSMIRRRSTLRQNLPQGADIPP